LPVSSRKRRVAASFAFVVLASLAILPTPASATFHLMSIREVYPGSTANTGSEYVELQMYAGGQQFVSTHSVTIYNAAGSLVLTSTFSADAASGANQSTILMATPEAEAQFGVAADGALSPGKLDPAGGAACWAELDCVSWGNFSGPLPSAAGSPATPGGIPDGMALRRTIAPNCPTLLEAADDHNNSAQDFEAVFPSPRPNSVTPTEHACASSGGGGGGGGSAAGRPQTTLRGKPSKRTHDRTPTFRFGSDEDRATFQCKVDHKAFRSCRSPFTTQRLALGRHTFRVRAKDSSGELDPSPASFTFKVIGKR
jgi:hypothetical protein